MDTKTDTHGRADVRRRREKTAIYTRRNIQGYEKVGEE